MGRSSKATVSVSARLWRGEESFSQSFFSQQPHLPEVVISSTPPALLSHHPFPAQRVRFFHLTTFGIPRLTICRSIGTLPHGRRAFQESILLLALARLAEKTMVSHSQLLITAPRWSLLPLVILLNLILALTHSPRIRLLNLTTVATHMRL